MNGIIVYEQCSLKKNTFFAQKLLSELSELKAQVRIVTTDEVKGMRPEFAVMRVYDEEISSYLEERGVRVFNTARVASICNDKWKTYLALKDADIPLAQTQRAEECDIPFPRILKARHGHGGSEVFWIENDQNYRYVLKNSRDSMIAQPPIGERGRDLRVYLIGGKIVVAMLRKSDNDFRSNFSLGGSAERYFLSPNEVALVNKVYDKLGGDFVGMDFIPSKDGLIFNEAEDVVGCRMVYTYTDVDIIKLYAEHIANQLNKF